jgi:hypothetical protein
MVGTDSIDFGQLSKGQSDQDQTTGSSPSGRFHPVIILYYARSCQPFSDQPDLFLFLNTLILTPGQLLSISPIDTRLLSTYLSVAFLNEY